MSRPVENPRDWGEPIWTAEVGVPPAELRDRVDVAVVGAGFAGLAAAIALARAGERVHVLEAGRVGDGASGRTGGLALEATAWGPMERVEHSLEALRAAVRENGIECALDLGGCWEVRHLKAGEPVPEGPSWPDDGARLVVERTVPGGGVDPGRLVAGLAAAALRAGARIHEHVRAVRCVPGAPHELYTESRRILAERVLLAVDALPGPLLPVPGLRPALTLAVATEPLAPEQLADVAIGRMPFYTTDLPYLWGRATREGRLVIGSGLAFDPDGDLERVSVARSDVGEMFARIERRTRRLHPALAEAAITHRWGGPISFRPERPLLAEPAPGLVAAGAYAGHGVALSFRVGELAAERLRGGAALPSWGAV